LAHSIGDASEAACARSDLIEKRRKLMEAWASFLAAPPSRDTGQGVIFGPGPFGTGPRW